MKSIDRSHANRADIRYYVNEIICIAHRCGDLSACACMPKWAGNAASSGTKDYAMSRTEKLEQEARDGRLAQTRRLQDWATELLALGKMLWDEDSENGWTVPPIK